MCVLDEESKEEEKAMLADKKMVEDLLKKSSSKSLQTILSMWMKSIPDKEVSEKKRATRSHVKTSSSVKKRKSYGDDEDEDDHDDDGDDDDNDDSDDYGDIFNDDQSF
jgi:hypothetical protein